MDLEELTIEEKCENLMNVVVESRKRYGKMCVEYDKKTLEMEDKILNLHLNYLSNARFKPKHLIPDIDIDSAKKEANSFTTDIINRQQRIDNLMRNIRNTQHIVLQLKEDEVGRKFRQPVTADAMLAVARNKQLHK